MTNILKLLPLVVLTALLGGSGWAQPEKTEGQAPATGRSPLTYEVQKVETVKGIITGIEPATTASSLPEPIVFTMQTDQGKVRVFLGPNWFVDKQGIQFASLDKVEVTGSRVLDNGRPIILAAEIKKGEQTLKLRNEAGVPLWGGQKRLSGQ